jgi:mannosyltransferase
MGILVALFAAVVAFGLRSYEIGLPSYTIDEMVSIAQVLSSDPWSWSWDNIPGLYSLILKAWILIWGESEVTSRMLSAVFSAGSTAVLTGLAFRLGGWRSALLVGFFHIANPLSVNLAREARAYGLFEFLVSVQLALFFGFLGFGKRRSYGYLFVSLLSVGVHWLGILPFLMQMFWLSFSSDSPAAKARGLQLAGVAGIVLAAGILTHIRWDVLQWQLLKFRVEPLSRWPFMVTNDLVAGSGLSVLGAMTIVSLALKENRSPKYLRTLAILLVTIIFFATATGWLAERAILIPRYFVFLIPPTVLLLGLSMNQDLMDKTWRRWVALISMVVICVSVTVHWPVRQKRMGAP